MAHVESYPFRSFSATGTIGPLYGAPLHGSKRHQTYKGDPTIEQSIQGFQQSSILSILKLQALSPKPQFFFAQPATLSSCPLKPTLSPNPKGFSVSGLGLTSCSSVGSHGRLPVSAVLCVVCRSTRGYKDKTCVRAELDAC